MAEPWVDDATAAFEKALAELIGQRVPDRDPVLVGREAALEAVAGAIWADEIGPFYDSEGVQVLLGGVTKQAVSDRVRRHRLLALRTGSGRLVYPTFQFRRRDVVAGFGEVLGVLAPDDTEAWFIASWFTTIDPGLGGRTPVDALAAGDLPEVLGAAREVAASLRG